MYKFIYVSLNFGGGCRSNNGRDDTKGIFRGKKPHRNALVCVSVCWRVFVCVLVCVAACVTVVFFLKPHQAFWHA